MIVLQAQRSSQPSAESGKQPAACVDERKWVGCSATLQDRGLGF